MTATQYFQKVMIETSLSVSTLPCQSHSLSLSSPNSHTHTHTLTHIQIQTPHLLRSSTSLSQYMLNTQLTLWKTATQHPSGEKWRGKEKNYVNVGRKNELKDYKSLRKCKRVSVCVSVCVSVDYHEIMSEKQWKRRERENLYDRHTLFSKGHEWKFFICLHTPSIAHLHFRSLSFARTFLFQKCTAVAKAILTFPWINSIDPLHFSLSDQTGSMNFKLPTKTFSKN